MAGGGSGDWGPPTFHSTATPGTHFRFVPRPPLSAHLLLTPPPRPRRTYLQATCSDKKGLLAPGMSEEVVVEFCPSHYRYYYDCIRVNAEVGTLRGRAREGA